MTFYFPIDTDPFIKAVTLKARQLARSNGGGGMAESLNLKISNSQPYVWWTRLVFEHLVIKRRVKVIAIKPSQIEVAPLHRTVVISHKRRLIRNTKGI